MASRDLSELVREAVSTAAALRQATRDLEQAIGDVEKALVSLGLGGEAHVHLFGGLLSFRRFGEVPTYRLLIEESPRRRVRPLVDARGERLEAGIAAIPALLAELVRNARTRTEEVGARVVEARVVRDQIQQNPPKSAPK